MENDESNRNECFFEEWLVLQKQELYELQQVATRNDEGHDSNNTESIQVLNKIVKNFEEYVEERSRMIRSDVLPYSAPPWCSSLENSVLWIGGCRPSSYIRLVYALCGLDIESNLNEFLQGEKIGYIGELSATQMTLVDKLQKETIAEERKLTEEMACLQDDIVDKPFAEVGRRYNKDCQLSAHVEDSLGKHDQSMAAILAEADQLRLKTTKEVIKILTPAQAVNFLAAGKKLRLCMREWGMKSDQEHGRN